MASLGWKGLKTSQAKVLTEGGDFHEAQVDVPRSVSNSCVDRIAGLFDRHLNSNWGMCLRYVESGSGTSRCLF
jgi:hypothetical protein